MLRYYIKKSLGELKTKISVQYITDPRGKSGFSGMLDLINKIEKLVK
ncbi:MAG: hypothetical protein ACXAAH_12460 [Promethearchaeota archaeon]